MSWMQKLCEVYDACEHSNIIGNYDASPVFVPLYHGTQQAQVELTITMQGELVRGSARAITNKDKAETIIMGDPESLAVAAAIKPKALFEKLIYLAGDYPKYYVQTVKKNDDSVVTPSAKNTQPELYHRAYVEQLTAWCQSEYAHPYAQAWLAYIQKGCLITDLVSEGVFELTGAGKLPSQWAVKSVPQDAFVRFYIKGHDGLDVCVWKDKGISNAYIQYLNSLPAEQDVCYAVGKVQTVSATSPKYIRYAGDATKLISSNDSDGFTYRGRFENDSEALAIGRETTEKAHAALKWLIQKQGCRNGEQVVLAFGTGSQAIPPPVESSYDTVNELEMFESPQPKLSTKESISNELAAAIRSLRTRLNANDDAIVIGLDSAIKGKGRLAIFYYREMGAEEYFNRILQWHADCTWHHTHLWVKNGFDDEGKQLYKNVWFLGAPSLKDIVLAAYGKDANEKLVKSALERLLPCVVDSANVPKDMVEMLARRAAHRASMGDDEREKVLSIACALLKKQRIEQKLKGALEVGIDYNNRDRDYLFGRVLACAEMIERVTLDAKGEDRITNAERFMVAYTKHPASTLCLIKTKLQIYINRAKKEGEDWLDRWVDEFYILVNMLTANVFDDTKLGNLYLLGYASQRMRMKAEYKSKNKSENALKEEE